MNIRLLTVLAFLQLAGTAAMAQQAAPLAPAAVPNPTYTSVAAEIEVDRPAQQVWARVGKFCDVGEWVGYPCTITAGTDGQLGAVRLVNNRVTEMLAGRTELSYTYVMPVRVGEPYNAMHGTLEARPLGATRTRLIYSQVYDNSVLADDAARTADLAARRGRITRAVQRMKALAEGGQ
jgi:hypothetical protein